MALFQPHEIRILNPFEALYPIFIDSSGFCDTVENFLLYAKNYSMYRIYCHYINFIQPSYVRFVDFDKSEAALVEQFNVFVEKTDFDKTKKQMKITSLAALKNWMSDILKQTKIIDNDFEKVEKKIMKIAYIIKAIIVVNGYYHLSIERRWNNILHFHCSTKHVVDVSQCVKSEQSIEVEGYNVKYKFKHKTNKNTYVYQQQIEETIVDHKGVVKKRNITHHYLNNNEHDFLIHSDQEEKQEEKEEEKHKKQKIKAKGTKSDNDKCPDLEKDEDTEDVSIN